ncbi:bifunctional lysylphosphatidylglycerol flippase/synthetase MprF [Corynebacterium pacaense]|uniref:bifunctional lysylphosphatidylglycerol flippase/synthetase MprF n=1 Tax=Corynebacterium pacaense TaxID=1816684 RepID=UPI001177945B|nr:phosphatidylglycerol lysyltransferase domain-containing protein [Corynebacterium pacaense]
MMPDKAKIARYARVAVGFAPLSAIAIVIIWVLREVLGPDTETLWRDLGVEMPWHLADLHLLTASLTTGTRGGAVVATIAVVLFAVPAERVLGRLHFLIAAVVFALVVTPAGFLVARALAETGLWKAGVLDDTFLSPSGWIMGVAALATGSMRVLWRRRLRLVIFAVTLTLLFYTGTVSDVVAVTCALAGLLVGEWRNRGVEKHSASLREGRILVATLATAVAAGPVIAGLDPYAEGPFSAVTRLIWQPAVSMEHMRALCALDHGSEACQDAILLLQQNGVGPMVANLVPLFVQVVIALGLMRGRRLAWWLAVAAQLVTIAVIAQPGIVLLPWIIVLVVLVAMRRRFLVLIDASLIGRAAAYVGATFLATAAIWIIGALLLFPHATLVKALAELPNRYLPPVVAQMFPRHLFPHSTPAWALYEWTGTIFWLVVCFVLYRLLMSVPSRSHEADRERAREILRSGTGEHLSWMALWDGNSYWFGEGGFVAYRLQKGVAVTVGGPVTGPGADRDAVADGFEKYAIAQGWVTAWYSVADDFSRSRLAVGFQRVHVAEESVLSTEDLSFKGKKFQNIRTARNRAEKEGVHAVWTSWAELERTQREQIISLSEQWVSEKALPEMGFTLGSVNEMKDPDTKLLLAIDDDGRLHGMTSWLPVYEQGHLVGYSLDVMRRDDTGFKPVIEFLLAEAALKAKDLGLQWVSLSGAPLATSEVMSKPGFLDVTLDAVGRTMEPLYGFRSLAASKHKFHPTHHGWYLCYRDELTLPTIGLAVASCYLPQIKTSDAVAAMKIWVSDLEHAESATK